MDNFARGKCRESVWVFEDGVGKASTCWLCEKPILGDHFLAYANRRTLGEYYSRFAFFDEYPPPEKLHRACYDSYLDAGLFLERPRVPGGFTREQFDEAFGVTRKKEVEVFVE